MIVWIHSPQISFSRLIFSIFCPYPTILYVVLIKSQMLSPNIWENCKFPIPIPNQFYYETKLQEISHILCFRHIHRWWKSDPLHTRRRARNRDRNSVGPRSPKLIPVKLRRWPMPKMWGPVKSWRCHRFMLRLLFIRRRPLSIQILSLPRYFSRKSARWNLHACAFRSSRWRHPSRSVPPRKWFWRIQYLQE